MSRIVLDASALLAVLNRETGSDKLTPQLLCEAVASTLSLAEVQGKLVGRGIAPDQAWGATLSSIQEAVDFTPEQARAAGSLIAQTRALGLSLGDRACLALALSLHAPVYTADELWKNLKVGVRIHVIR